MNDEQDPQQDQQPDPGLDPDEEARVRALLADLGTAPEAAAMPPEVAARLDEALAGLVAEREGAPGDEGGSGVVPLRRRWAPRAAAAAAAVIVVGAGGVAAANLGVFSSGPNATTSSDAGSSAESRTESLEEPKTANPPGTAGQPNTGLLSRDVPRVRAASFDTDVARLLEQGQIPSPAKDTAANERKAQQNDAADAATGGCYGPEDSDRSEHSTVLYDGSPAALVVHPQRSGERLVEAWTCTGDRRLDSARVPVEQTSGQSSPGDPGLGSPDPTP